MTPFGFLCRHPKIIFFYFLVFILVVFHTGFAQQQGTNFFITAGQNASIANGDSLFRAVYYISCPLTTSGLLYLRVFDADIGGQFDQVPTPSRMRYRLFGKGRIDTRVRSIHDSIDAKGALIDLELGQDDLYDNRWRTMASFQAKDGETNDSLSTFQFIVDGISGTGTNLYQLFVSSDEKGNTAVDGVEIKAPIISIYLPASNMLVTHIPFPISRNAKFIDVYNFDSDGAGEMFIQTVSREKTPVCVSGNGVSCSSRIPILENEKGTTGALILTGDRSKADYRQCRITDDSGTILPFLLPPMLAPMNHLPVPKFLTIPLSDCLSFVLDASGTEDPDGDAMSFQWFIDNQSIGNGQRIVHQFPQAGQFPVRLIVKDNSGFVANAKELTKTIGINSAPSAEFDVPQTAVPFEELIFDGSRSRDKDGQILQYVWNFGDGVKATGKTVRHAYALAGKYRAALLVTDDSQSPCNSNEKPVTVWINSPPVPKIRMGSPVAVREDVPMDGLTSMDSDGEILRYVWDLGDGSTAEGASVNHRYQAPGTYRVQLGVQDNAGVKNSIQKTEASLVVNAPPLAAAKSKTIASVGEAIVFDASGSRDPDGEIVEYKWDFGDGTVQMGKQAQHAYEKSGQYDVKLGVKDNSNAINSEAEARFPIRVNAPPLPDAGGDRVVNSSTVFFDAKGSKDEDDAIIDYTWDFGDNQSAHGQRVQHTYALPGPYNVKLIVKDASGTSTDVRSDQIRVTVNHPPVADAGRKRVVATGEPVVFDGSFSHDPDGEIIEYQWQMEQGVIKSGKRVTHEFQNPGTYQAQLTVRDNAGAEDVHSTEIVVNAKPIACIAAVERKAPGQSVIFDGSASRDPDGKITEAEWDFGDGSPPKNGLTIPHVYSTPGRYKAVLTVRDDNQASNSTDMTTATVSINHAPVPVAEQNLYSCSQTIRFDASRSIDADNDPIVLYWNFGDSATGIGRQVTHTYKRPGLYPARLTADDGYNLPNSKTDIFIKVHINSSPSAVIDAQEEVCAGENALFDASRSSDPDNDPLKYVWDFGDGSTGEGVNPVHLFKKGGYYRILLTVTDNSGMQCDHALAETVVHVVDAPVAEAGENQVVCTNKPVSFDGSLSSGGNRPIQSVEWDFGDGQQGGGIRAFHTYNQAGLYTVRLKISVPPEGSCENVSEDQLTVRVLPSPVVTFDFDPTGCPDKDIYFYASKTKVGDTTGADYAWDFGDGTSGKGVQTAHRYQKPGNYTVHLTVVTDANQECNTASAEHAVFINARPRALMKITASSDSLSAIAPYSMVTFNAQKSEDGDGFIRRYSWDFGDGGFSEGVFVQHQFKRSGRYKVKLVVQDNSGTSCSTDTASTLLTVTDAPVWTIEGPQEACIEQAVAFSLKATGSGNSAPDPVIWLFSDGDTLQGVQVAKSFHSAGKYQVQAVCRDAWSTTKNIQIIALPSVSLPDRLEADVEEPVEIQPVIVNENHLPLIFQWDLGDGTRSDQPSVRHVYQRSGIYNATFTLQHADFKSCPSSIHNVGVDVYPKPDAAILIRPDTLYSGGARDEATFKAVLSDSTRDWIFRWDFGDGQTASGRCVNYSYPQAGSFTVQLAVWDASRKTARKYTATKHVQVQSRYGQMK